MSRTHALIIYMDARIVQSLFTVVSNAIIIRVVLLTLVAFLLYKV